MAGLGALRADRDDAYRADGRSSIGDHGNGERCGRTQYAVGDSQVDGGAASLPGRRGDGDGGNYADV